MFVNFGLNPRDLSILQHTFVYSIVFPVLGHQHSQPGCLKFNQSLFLFVLCPKWRKVVSGAFSSGIPWAPLCQSLQARGKKKASWARLGIQDLGHGHGSTSGPQVLRCAMAWLIGDGYQSTCWEFTFICFKLPILHHFTSFFIILPWFRNWSWIAGYLWSPSNPRPAIVSGRLWRNECTRHNLPSASVKGQAQATPDKCNL